MKAQLSSPTNPTINDIARVAEVSLATVDRVLNARPGVRETTVAKVNRAIEELGYVRDTAAAALARGRFYHFTFVLPQNDNAFIALLEQQINMLALTMRHERTKLSAVRVAAFDPVALAKAIEAIDPATVDGVAVFGPETPSVRDAISHLKANGVTVVSPVADIPSSERDHYIGVDNVAAGRTAAQLMGRFLTGSSGKILVVSGSMLARDHLERRLGFDEVIARDFPDLDVLPSVECRDDPALLRQLLPAVFADNADLVGVYSSAGGNEGLLEYLAQDPTAKRPVVVAHELTDLTRPALAEGWFDAVISQDAGHLVRSAVRVMRATSARIPINSAQERIRIEILLRDNLI